MPQVGHSDLSTFAEDLLRGLDTPPDVASTVADALVEADRNGHHSHGVRMLLTYAERVDGGSIRPSARPEIVHEDGTSVQIDGHSGFGHLTAQRAVDEGGPKAAERGVSVVGIRNGTHLGCIGTWARRAAARGLAFVGFVCNPTSTYVAPPGRREGRLSTNPLAIGLPSFDALPYPLVHDMATSQVAFGKIKEAAAESEAIPDEWAMPYEGKPDPQGMVDGRGALQPLGGTVSGYKGFGLATMIELLASSVADTPVSGQDEAGYGNSAMFAFVDPLHFTTRERLEDRITGFREYVLSEEPDEDLSIGDAASGDLGLPGEPEYREQTAQAEGVDLRPADARSLRDLADVLGVTDVPQSLRGD